MSEVTTTTAAPVTAPVSTTPAPASKVETPAISQVETTQTPASPLNALPTTEVAVQKPAPKPAPAAKETAKLDYNEMIAKDIDGTITPEDIAAIEQAGLSKDQFKMMSEAQKAIQIKNNDALYSVVGGKESYESLKSFAVEHLSDDEIDMYNGALASGNMKMAEMAVLGLKAMSEKVRGKNPSLRLGSDDTGVDVMPYGDQQSLIKDLNSRQYRMDPAFRATVDNRRAKSGF